MQYLRARYYLPAQGIFNRLDPFFGNQDDPQSLHKYAYVHGDPVNGIDPSGLFTLIGMMKSVGMQSFLVGMSVPTLRGITTYRAGGNFFSGFLAGLALGGAMATLIVKHGGITKPAFVRDMTQVLFAGMFNSVAVVYTTTRSSSQIPQLEYIDAFWDGAESTAIALATESFFDLSTTAEATIAAAISFSATFILQTGDLLWEQMLMFNETGNPDWQLFWDEMENVLADSFFAAFRTFATSFLNDADLFRFEDPLFRAAASVILWTGPKALKDAFFR